VPPIRLYIEVRDEGRGVKGTKAESAQDGSAEGGGGVTRGNETEGVMPVGWAADRWSTADGPGPAGR